MTGIGFIGVGRMGTPMVKRLLAAGHDVTVCDPNRAAVETLVSAGARSVATPAELADLVELVFFSLPTPEVVEVVALGKDGLAEGRMLRMVVDLSTTGPKASRRLAAELAARNIAMVDCPVSGGVARAENGTLALMASGREEHFRAAEPFLEVLGKVNYVGGEPGHAQLIKVINNLMSVTALAIASEGLVLAQKSGLDPEALIRVVNAGTGRSNASEDKVPKHILTRSFDFGFALGLSAKDIRLCLEEAEALGVPMIVGNAVRQLLTIARGLAGENGDLTEIIKPVEQWAGVEVAAGSMVKK